MFNQSRVTNLWALTRQWSFRSRWVLGVTKTGFKRSPLVYGETWPQKLGSNIERTNCAYEVMLFFKVGLSISFQDLNHVLRLIIYLSNTPKED